MKKHQSMLIILLSLILISFYCVSVAQGDASSSADWTMFHNDLSHTGSTSEGGSANSAKIMWNFTTMYNVESSPAVADGYVFLGDDGGTIYCLNSSDGQMVWYHTTGGWVTSSPAVVNNVVYVGSHDNNVYALNAENGTVLWNYPTRGEVESSPAVANGAVYVGSDDGNLYALNATDGTRLWSYPTGGEVTSSPAVINGVVYVGSYDTHVYALNATSGVKIWSYQTGSRVESSPAVANGVVYVGSDDGNLYALNAVTGDLLWQYQTQDDVWSSPAIANGYVYVGSDNNNLYCFNASSGKKIWQSPTGYWVRSSPAVADGNVYVGSEDFSVYCFNASTGAKEWSYASGNIIDSSPAIAEGDLYIGTQEGYIYAFALYNSTVSSATPQSSTSPKGAMIELDAFAAASFTGAAIILVAFFVRSNRQNRQNKAADISTPRSWLSTHTDAVCVLLILAFSSILFINLGNGSLWPSDEQWYSQWAFHMIRTGDFLTPWAFGWSNLWIAKPPLNMWLMALAYQVFGVTNFASRFFSAVFGALSLVLIFFLGKKMYNVYVGLLSALFLGTFTTFYVFARLAMTDVPLVFFILGSIYFFVLSEKSKNANWYAALSGLFFGLALMTKQIEALLLPLILIFYLIATKKNVRFFFTKTFTLFWGVGLLVFSPWLIYMNSSFGLKFWQWYFMYTDVTRTVSPIEGHAGSYFYYFSYLANNENLVWVILMPFAAGLCVFNAAVKRVKEDTLILLWMAIVLLVFSFAQTKLYWYILPAAPAFAIAVGSLIYQLSEKTFQLLKKRQRSA